MFARALGSNEWRGVRVCEVSDGDATRGASVRGDDATTRRDAMRRRAVNETAKMRSHHINMDVKRDTLAVSS